MLPFRTGSPGSPGRESSHQAGTERPVRSPLFHHRSGNGVSRIIREISGLERAFLCVFCFCVNFSEFVVDIGVSSNSRTDIDTDWRRVDQFDLCNAFCSMFFICDGIFCPLIFALSAGIRLSSTIVVFPEPETPVTTVSRPIGIRTSKGCTV